MNSKDETPKVDATKLRRNRKMAIIIGTCFILVLISMVYAFVQQVAAERNAEQAFVQEALAREMKQMADQSAKEAVRQEAIAQEFRRQLDECIRSRR